MLFTITISLTVLVIINLLLLKFSCNKTTKRATVDKKPVIFTAQITIPQNVERLAPTGS